MEVCIFKNWFQVTQECKSKHMSSENFYKQVYQFLINFLRWANLLIPLKAQVLACYMDKYIRISNTALIPLMHHVQHSGFP